ncbi:MAG: hypothetical protein EOO75_04210 [Myxococcales bacterium]|nr:MAG: hypothetical protein EOO75_04210 [Myxococcales bacterium]
MTNAATVLPSACRAMAPALDTYLDGELSPAQIVETETHLNQCTSCRERVAVDRAMRASLRKVVPLRAPSSLRERMAAAMAAERARQASEGSAPPPAVEPVPAAPADETPGAQIIAFCRHDSTRMSGARACRSAAPVVASTSPVMALTRPEPAARPATVTSLEEHRAQRPLRVRYAVPFAVAAAAAFAVTVHGPMQAATSGTASPAPPAPTAMRASMGLDGIVDELVSMHAQPLPPEVTQPDEVHRFDPFVGVPVEPPKLQTFGAKWVGGRILPLRDSRAAMLQYSLAGGHRISVYVYDPRQVNSVSTVMRQRVVRDANVYVGNIRGYNVAATERRGVGYAIATDLDEPESMELVAASAH